MAGYIARRLLWLPIILFTVSFVTFVLGRYGPGDPVQVLMGQHSNPAVVERIREQRGLNDNIFVQYGRYIGNVVRGDFGESFKYRGRTVAELLKAKMWISAQLNIAAMILSVGLGVPIGMFAALRQGTLWDTAAVMMTLSWQAVPVFLTAPVLLWVFAWKLDILPTHGWDGFFLHQHHPASLGHGHTGRGDLDAADPGQHAGGHQPGLRADGPGQGAAGNGGAEEAHSSQRTDSGGDVAGAVVGGDRVHVVHRGAVLREYRGWGTC